MSMSVKTETISNLAAKAKEALESKQSALAVDAMLTNTSGFGNKETEGLFQDTNEALKALGDPSTESNVFEVRCNNYCICLYHFCLKNSQCLTYKLVPFLNFLFHQWISIHLDGNDGQNYEISMICHLVKMEDT